MRAVEWSNIGLEQMQAFLVCLARMGALVGSMPVFSGSQNPMRMRAGLAIVLSLLVFPVVQPYIPQKDFSPFMLGIWIIQESLFGIFLGFIARLIFFAAQFGGTVVGYQMGFAAANILDPQNQQQIPLLSQFQNVLAILLFLALDIHHLFLRVLVHSYEILPPGELTVTRDSISFLIDFAGNMFVLGLQLSAPMLAVLVLSTFVLGIMARVFTQLNVFLLSFPINISLAFIIFALTIDLVLALLGQQFSSLGEQFLQFMHLL